MSVLRVFLFGKFRVCCGQQTLTGLEARKVQELFCYLLLHRDRPHPRETLADLLWGDNSTTQSKKYLRKALWQLQTAIDSQAQPLDDHVLLVEPDWVQLDPEADLWLDVAEFEQAFGLVQGVPGRDLDLQRVQSLQSAVGLYRGDLLEGWYQDWCLYERERLQQMYLIMLDKLMGYCEAHYDCEAGLVYGALILRCDRARERTHRRLMRLYSLARDRTAALRQYERCVTALDEELGVRPTRRTVALYEQIRADQLDGPALPVDVHRTPETVTWPLLKILGHLKQLQGVLADVHRQVQQDIREVELTLDDQL
jgi:DNA-binding SARP family transcriptional activator